MNKYALRKNFNVTFEDHNKIIRAKLAFKTKEINWLYTQESVIILVSVHSLFHQGISGDLKMSALISVIKNHVNGKVTILLTDMAHLHTESLKYQNCIEKASEECIKEAHLLATRYSCYFEACDLVFWHSYISQDATFISSMKLIRKLYESDDLFQEHLYRDAESSYTDRREKEFSNKELFIEKSIEDLLTQCACVLVIANKGYRFQFYTGNSFASVEYVNQLLIIEEKRLSWINVFLAVEKKRLDAC